MVKETILKLYKHFQFLSKGSFTQADFNKELGEGGRISLGEITPERRKLIISDAKMNIERLEKKFPHLVKKEEVIEKKEKVKKSN